MKNWNKKEVSREVVKALHDNYGLDALTASILARRGITQGKDLMYFLESDLRFLHNPFLFSNMEDAVDRILDAKEEDAKILIFGDDDVDGISSTAILYEYLKQLGADVQWRLPSGDDAYGLSMQAVDDFSKAYGSLIITVDCGISNVEEIAHANELGIDVIVTDHHNPPAILPAAAVIIDPKLPDSGYPFSGISGAAVAYKLVSALRFARCDLYKQDVCLLNVRPGNGNYIIECVKLRNLAKKSELTITLGENSGSVMDTRLPAFLSGQQIFVWDSSTIQKQLSHIFGNGVEFNMMDLRPLISRLIPQLADKSLLAVKDLSRIAKYSETPATELDGFYNLFVTFSQKNIEKTFPKNTESEAKDLQLVMLAALADIVPLVNENRILVRAGIAAINSGKLRPGLAELFARLSISGKEVGSADFSWTVIPCLNAAGRLGQSNLALQLLLSENPAERDSLAEKIISMNEQRKDLVTNASAVIGKQADDSFEKYQHKLCVVIDERINKGITGILASRLVGIYDVPSIAVTIDGDTAIGSIRSCRGHVATQFLDSFGDFFINHGGHNYAAGFSFRREKLGEFTAKIESLAPAINLEGASDTIDIDAELPAAYLTPQLLPLISKLEPFGEGCPEPVFFTKSLSVSDALVIGKSEPHHLKLTFDCGKFKFPALFWREADRLNKDFKIGDKLDVLYKVERNSFNGAVTPQMNITDIKISE